MDKPSALVTVAILMNVLGCASGPPSVPVALVSPVDSHVTEPSVQAQAPVSPPRGPQERPEWNQYFAQEQVTGTIALLDTQDGQLACSNVPLCERATIPASTFKIAHSMIALETGVVEDSESVLAWDGTEYPVEAWNRDHTLRTAVQVSCVPCFQAIARKVGEERMGEWLVRLDYGNHEMGGPIDRFWLTGGLLISPLGQIDFLRRFAEGALPISKRTAETVQDIITVDVGNQYVLVGKTGLQQPPEYPELAGWFVGWLQLGERHVYFATLINGHLPDVDVGPARQRVTERVLSALGLLPEDVSRALDK